MLTYFFDQLFASVDPDQDEVIVVSDGCRDVQVLKTLKEQESQVNFLRLLSLPEKVGYGRASNIGAAESNADALVFINTDVFPNPGAIHVLAEEVRHDQSIGAVQGLLVYPQTCRVQSTGHIFYEFLNFHALEGRQVEHPLVQKRTERQALCSAFYAVRREIFMQFQGFDEFFYNAWEGMELTLRITDAGMRCIYTPKAQAFHVTGGGRRHLPLDETQQAAYFWSKWGTRITNDLISLVAEQLTPTILEPTYVAINCGSTTTWKNTLQSLRLKVRQEIQVPDRFESRICLYDNLPRAVLEYPGPLIFFADYFEQLTGNKSWFQARAHTTDVIIDLRGNVLSSRELS
jgi:GT2 family glycosyltransferase